MSSCTKRIAKQMKKCRGQIRDPLLKDLQSNGFTYTKSTEYIDDGKGDGKKEVQFFHLTSHTNTATCPCCGMTATSVHDFTKHVVQVIPIDGITTFLEIYSKKFVCGNPECRVKTFAEPLPGVDPYSERSAAFDTYIVAVSTLTSFRETCEFLNSLGFCFSIGTLRKLYKKIKVPDNPHVTRIGIDDAALEKGHKFVTVIYDYDTGMPIKLIKGRANDEIRDWLKAHMEIKVIVRDRLSAYGKLIAEVRPDCDVIQVADRFHLIKNLSDRASKILRKVMPMRIQICDGVIKIEGKEDIKPEAGISVPDGEYTFHCNDILAHISTRDPVKKEKTKYKNLERCMPFLRQAFPIISKAEKIISEYHEAIMGGNPDRIDEFITKYENDSDMKRFCASQKKDIAPIKNAISSDYNSGLVEGNNNKFKVLKRIVYGRAHLVNFEKRFYLYFLKAPNRIAFIQASLAA